MKLSIRVGWCAACVAPAAAGALAARPIA
ncbi:MAG: hypothetical protein JWO25_968, partial [Alphaproteobacteria bacterium]|nr:hypothetical protein [Alphaproteobacteria bacterium]